VRSRCAFDLSPAPPFPSKRMAIERRGRAIVSFAGLGETGHALFSSPSTKTTRGLSIGGRLPPLKNTSTPSPLLPPRRFPRSAALPPCARRRPPSSAFFREFFFPHACDGKEETESVSISSESMIHDEGEYFGAINSHRRTLGLAFDPRDGRKFGGKGGLLADKAIRIGNETSDSQRADRQDRRKTRLGALLSTLSGCPDQRRTIDREILFCLAIKETHILGQRSHERMDRQNTISFKHD